MIMKRKEIVNLIKAILYFGIDLELKTRAEELKIIYDMHSFINKKVKLRSYLDEGFLTIETSYYDPLVIVDIEKSIMSIIPVTDEGFYDALATILEFLADVTKKDEFKRKQKEKEIKDEDFEWI